MYFPYLRGRQFELIALRELVDNDRMSEKVIPIVEPVKPTSTLLKTLKSFSKKKKKIVIIFNPTVGNFRKELLKLKKSDPQKASELIDVLSNDECIMKGYIMCDEIVNKIKDSDEKKEFVIINRTRDDLDHYQRIFKDVPPMYSLIPDDRAYKRVVTESRVLLEDCFNKKERNADYSDTVDEFYSDIHLFYEEENYTGFADYTVVGEDYNESGFAPIAVVIHIIYFDNDNYARIHHFVSDSNDDIEDPARKFGEALDKLVKWCDSKDVAKTLGLSELYKCYEEKRYPGLGVVKKMSIMHHLELISDYLEEKK